MGNIIERLKRIPVPIWIGLALAVLLVMWMSSRASKSGGGVQGGGAITGATVGAPGVQGGAGADQAVGNLSAITQTGFADIAKNEKANADASAMLQSGLRTGFTQQAGFQTQETDLLSQILAAMRGTGGTTMTQFGGAMQGSMNAGSQAGGGGGQQVATHANQQQGTSLFNVPIVDAQGGAGWIQVVAHNAESAVENAHQGGNTPTGPAEAV